MWAYTPRLLVNPGVISDEGGVDEGRSKSYASSCKARNQSNCLRILFSSTPFLGRSAFYVSLHGSVNRTWDTVLGCWASEQAKQRPPHLGARQLAHSDIASSPSLLSHPFFVGSTFPQQFEKSFCLVAGVTPMIQVPPYRFIALPRVLGRRRSRFAR